jgi:hypothetical protein
MQAGDAAGPHVAADIQVFAIGPDHARGLHGQGTTQQRDTHELPLPTAFAFVQRGGNPGSEQRRRVIVHYRAINDLRCGPTFALEAANAGHRLQHLVIAGLVAHWPRLAVTGDGAIDQAIVAATK